MTNGEFTESIIAMTDTLYRVSYSFLREKCDREDAVQACILKAWAKRGALRDKRYLKTWVIRILINECKDILRHNKRALPLTAIPEAPAPKDMNYPLRDALLRLPEKLRTPCLLYHMEGYSTREIAKMLKIPQGTVKSRMRKAERELREALKEVSDDE